MTRESNGKPSDADGLNRLDSSLYDAKLRSAVELAWEDPTKEFDPVTTG